jgi:hypothetical protein
MAVMASSKSNVFSNSNVNTTPVPSNLEIPHLLGRAGFGGQVSGNLYNSYPSLDNLDPYGNIQYNVDYRQIYGSILDDWGGIDQSTVLGSNFFNTISVFQ